VLLPVIAVTVLERAAQRADDVVMSFWRASSHRRS
jgi:hypothetical protein